MYHDRYHRRSSRSGGCGLRLHPHRAGRYGGGHSGGGGNTYNLRDGVYCKGEALVKVSFAANGTVNIGVVDVNLASNDNAYPFNVEGYQYV